MLGLILAMSVTRAGVQDRDVALSLIGQAKEEHAGLSVAYMDGGYRGSLESRIEKDTGVRVEIVLRSDTQKRFRGHTQAMDRRTNLRLAKSV